MVGEMLEDRSYMREGSDSRRSVTLMLLITLVVIWVIHGLLYRYTSLGLKSPFEIYLELSNDGIKEWRIWQLFTFQFLHARPEPWHLLFNCFTLYIFGRGVEETLGAKGFLKVFFFSGFLGGLVQVLVNLIFGRETSVVGASAGVMGLVVAYAVLFPERDFYFWFILVKPKYLVWFFIAISVYGVLVPYGRMAHAAHLGGMLGGFAYLRWGSLAEKLFVRRRVRPRPRELIKVHLPKSSPWHKADPEDIPPGEFISREVDPILDKISAHGIQSLTPRERKILEAARAKMERR